MHGRFTPIARCNINLTRSTISAPERIDDICYLMFFPPFICLGLWETRKIYYNCHILIGWERVTWKISDSETLLQFSTLARISIMFWFAEVVLALKIIMHTYIVVQYRNRYKIMVNIII